MRGISGAACPSQGKSVVFKTSGPSIAGRERAPRHGRSAAVRPQASSEDLDPIERAVGWLFGKKAVDDRKPFGLSRLEGTALKQQYEANATDVAAAFEGDSPEVAEFRSVLANTVLEACPLNEIFNADQHGWDKDAFHSCVKDQGAAVVVARTKGGSLLGGYNPFGWEGYGDQLDTRAAFLFTWPDGDLQKAAIKLPKVGGPGLAVMDDPDRGPKFGAEGLSIPLQSKDNPRAVQCRLGTFYAKMPDGSRSLFPEGSSTELAELKVYVAE